MIVDAHLHVWDPAVADYPWLGPELGDLNRAVTLSEIEPTLDARGIGGVILVQSSDDPRDTENMLALARTSPRIVGVVAFSPLDKSERVAEDLLRFADEPVIVGIRNLVHEHPAQWMERPEVEATLGVLEDAGMPLDFPTANYAALSRVVDIARRHPGLSLVIDHLGKPPIGGSREDYAAWRNLITACAAQSSVTAKLSGLYSSVGDLADWNLDQIRPVVHDALDLFGADRLMYGGDWPISVLAGGYPRTWDALDALLAPLSAEERAAVFGGTARRTYAIDPDRWAAAARTTPGVD
ncbi:amidohydrolase [Microbacterium sp. RURRCA19A]|uniref:amidohydrolase family protein n=1 Tax=Microbacterium sp. RURRCA19A TaxID=1907391 RepID=UPI000953F0A5|nr:amidohydrolase family protein [Microbacterium sp. RURRCA19A]SIS19926.1 L-fuconolactonase [Microbacterium sp. RURRCA19A]